MGSMAVAINVFVIDWDGLSPGRSATKIIVLDVDASVNDIHVDVAASRGGVFIALAKELRFLVMGETD